MVTVEQLPDKINDVLGVGFVFERLGDQNARLVGRSGDGHRLGGRTKLAILDDVGKALTEG